MRFVGVCEESRSGCAEIRDLPIYRHVGPVPDNAWGSLLERKGRRKARVQLRAPATEPPWSDSVRGTEEEEVEEG